MSERMWLVYGTNTVSGRNVIRSVLVVSVSYREMFTPRVDFILTEFLSLCDFLSPTDNTDCSDFSFSSITRFARDFVLTRHSSSELSFIQKFAIFV